MKLLGTLSLCLLISASQLLASEIKIQGLCDSSDYYTVLLSHMDNKETVGSLTIRALEELNLDYIGSDKGITAIEDSPTGSGALEYRDAKNLKSYGWCYLVSDDDSLPSQMPHEYPIHSEDQDIHWFYAYSEMLSGNWISFCVPTHIEKPKFICEDS